jgi:hypothetical protein
MKTKSTIMTHSRKRAPIQDVMPLKIYSFIHVNYDCANYFMNGYENVDDYVDETLKRLNVKE